MSTIASGDGQGAGIGKGCFTVVGRLWVEVIVLSYISGWLGVLSGRRRRRLPSASRMPVTGKSKSRSESRCRGRP
jgi:hypothetical protein